MYDPGLARLDDIMAGMLEMETTQMFGGYGFLMNGLCVSASGTTRLSSASAPTGGMRSAASRMSGRWI